METQRQICTFTLDEHYFGVPVEKVQEIVYSREMTRVPLAHPAVRGLVNLRGQLLTTIDLRCRLNLGEATGGPQATGDRRQVNVVLRSQDGIVALLVDAMGDVLELDETLFETPPETLDPFIRRLIEGVYKLDERLLLILDTENTVDLTDKTISTR